MLNTTETLESSPGVSQQSFERRGSATRSNLFIYHFLTEKQPLS